MMRRLTAVALVVFLMSCGRDMSTTPSPVPTTTTLQRGNLIGTFEVTFAADMSACANLPPQARTRTYTATMYEGASPLNLSGARFIDSGTYGTWNVVYAKIANQTADYFEFQDPPLWEALSDESYVVIYGGAEHLAVNDNSKTLFWAKFEYCPEREVDSYPECEVPVLTCTSANHQLIFHRR